MPLFTLFLERETAVKKVVVVGVQNVAGQNVIFGPCLEQKKIKKPKFIHTEELQKKQGTHGV